MRIIEEDLTSVNFKEMAEGKQRNTMIISTFPGCGKTYLFNNQHRMKFSYNGEVKYCSFLDSDRNSSMFEKNLNSTDTSRYLEFIKSKIGGVDFIFVANHDCVLQALKESGLPFIVVTPDNSPWLDNKERQLIKQQWFGRFVLRDNNCITDFPVWLNHVKERYDVKTSLEHIDAFNPVAHFTLKENQYLSDIIQDLYWKKETYTERYCSRVHHSTQCDKYTEYVEFMKTEKGQKWSKIYKATDRKPTYSRYLYDFYPELLQ